MSKSLKFILFAAGGLVGLLVLFAVATFLFVDANAYKPRLEAAASEALGMEVRVGGRMGVGFFPGLSVTLEDVQIRNRGRTSSTQRRPDWGSICSPCCTKKSDSGRLR